MSKSSRGSSRGSSRESQRPIFKQIIVISGRKFNHAIVGNAGGEPAGHAAGQCSAVIKGDKGPGLSDVPDQGIPGEGVLASQPPLHDGPTIFLVTMIEINLEIDRQESKFKSHQLDLDPGCCQANPGRGSGSAKERFKTLNCQAQVRSPKSKSQEVVKKC